MEKSTLMNDCDIVYFNNANKSDGAKEQLMDYIIAWTLHHSEEQYKKKTPILHSYCSMILKTILGLSCEQLNIIFRDVKTIKQVIIPDSKKRIDIICNITASIGEQEMEWCILIEDKYFSNLNNNLEDYVHYFEEQCPDNVVKKCVLITAISRNDPKFHKYYDKAKTIYNFEIFSLDSFPISNLKDSESDLFNEFWLRDW